MPTQFRLPAMVTAFVLVAAAMTNCHCPPSRTRDPKSGRKASVVASPCLTKELRSAPADSLCPAERGVLEVAPGQLCPDISSSGWQVRQLWNHCAYVKIDPQCASTESQDVAQRPSCIATAKPDELAQLLEPYGRVERECKSWAAEDPSTRQLALSQHFDDLAHDYDLAAPKLQAPPPGSIPAKVVVKVVVIDTAPTDTATGRAMHGRLMAALVGRAAGVGLTPDCADQSVCVLTQLGLPLSFEDGKEWTSGVEGGFYGYPSDIAAAIEAALTGWDPSSERLVINLSIGWEPGLGNTDVVAKALAAARCKGALVLAAAGNRHPRSCTSGLTGPGYYGGWAAPSAQQCAAIETFAYAPRTSGQAALAHAVRAVDATGMPLPTSRSAGAGEPIDLDAFGVDAIVASPWSSNPTGPEWLGPQSGSSVATALRAGQAAALWAQHPEESAEQIVARLQDIPAASSTTSPPSVANRTFTPPEPVDITCEADMVDECGTTCTGLEETVRRASSSTSTYVPALLSSYVVPQPDDVICASCKIDKDTLFLSRSVSSESMVIKDVIVTISNASASETLHLGVQPVPLEPSFARYVDAELCSVGTTRQPPTSAWVDFVFSDSTGNLVSLGNPLTLGAACR